MRRRRQCIAVQLAVRRERQRRQADVSCRHHVGGQVARRAFAQRGHLGRTGVVGDEPLLAWRVLAGQHRDFLHAVHRCEPRLHFAQLDAESAHLHLKIVAADELDLSVAAPASEVARLVHPRAGAERIVDEALRAQLGPIQIAARDAVAADVQLPGDTHRNGLAASVEQIHSAVRERPPDAHAAHPRRMAHVGRAARDRDLRRPVCIDEPRVRRPDRVPLLELMRRQRIARHVDEPHAFERRRRTRAGAMPLADQLLPMRGRQMDHRRPGRMAARAAARAEQLDGRRERRAGRQRRHDFLQRKIEVQRVLLQHRFARPESEPANRIERVVHEIAVLDHHALRLSGRT
ncbi:conserved hypothetical protein [Burkholderia pseudomallei Pasteur 52237]|nr:conserved hypothetical protein [Burkholderia pseudomallei Pasteur 52237]EDO95226.1 conserved hypothetical protein [Burkholderia pseudomallei Pasteur 52237]